jgi:hypothetical protein
VDSQETSDTTFGLFICYILPGLTAQYGLPFGTPASGGWATLAGDANLPLPQLLVVLAQAVAVGLTVSTVRWLLVDTLHHRTGVKPVAWDFAALDRGVAAYELLIQLHYRYYKFYANMVVALLWAYATDGFALGRQGAAYWLLAGLFLLGSRDALRKYYDRVGRLLGPAA